MCNTKFLTTLVTVAFLGLTDARGSCRESALCCNGRDSSCVVQKTTLNDILEDPSEKPCYCDHACMKLGDCCFDFKESCGVTDCEVSEWGEWSDCDAKCGPGRMERRRTISREPHNGGRHCPALVQQRACHGHQCLPENQIKDQLRETAMLLPSSFSTIRQMNETHDIRKNLRLRYPKELQDLASYCVEFEVLKASRGCRKEDDFSSLREGDHVCAICEKQAQLPDLKFRCRGDGVNSKATRFAALSAFHCHGKWSRIEQYSVSDGECPSSCQSKFIFV